MPLSRWNLNPLVSPSFSFCKHNRTFFLMSSGALENALSNVGVVLIVNPNCFTLG